MKQPREYQDVMRKLYLEASKYPDKKLADAIAEVRDLVVEYKNIIDSYNDGMDKERAMYIAGRALGELIYGDGGFDPLNPTEIIQWIKNEFDMTDEELAELGIESEV